MRKVAKNAKSIFDWPGIKEGDELAPGALQSMILVADGPFDCLIKAHPATGNVPLRTSYYNSIVIAKDYVAKQEGLLEDPVKARTSVQYGLRVIKDPKRRTIIAYSKAWEYAQSDEYKEEIAKKKAKMEEEELARVKRQEERKAKAIAKKVKAEDDIATLTAKLEAAKRRAGIIDSDSEAPEAPVQAKAPEAPVQAKAPEAPKNKRVNRRNNRK